MLTIQNDAKNLKMAETLAYGYSPESSQQELSNEYQHDRIWMIFKLLHPCTLDESGLSIGRVKAVRYQPILCYLSEQIL